MGLSLLVQFAAPLLGGSWQGVQQDATFWELLRICLCDSAASSRKQARHVLKLAVQQPEGGCLPSPGSHWNAACALTGIPCHA